MPIKSRFDSLAGKYFALLNLKRLPVFPAKMTLRFLQKRKDNRNNRMLYKMIDFKLRLPECPVGRNYFLLAGTIVDLYRLYIIIQNLTAAWNTITTGS